MWSLLWTVFKFLGLIVLPFVSLIRGSIFFLEKYDLGATLSIGAGVGLTTILLFLYFTFIYSRLTKKIGDADNLKRRLLFALLLVVAYCSYGLWFMPAQNFKNPDLKKEIRDLHPLLRLGVSTFILVDKKMIITDASRAPEDYRRMGLKTNKHSLHYTQKDGYAYAIDLRTNNRNEVRNKTMEYYFRILGFNTLRHGGSGDHLHVSLYCKYRPGAR